MPATQAFLAFNAGELTPYLRHRTDFDKQSSGAELMQNFVAMPFGGVRKRAGTRHVAALTGPTRLESFQFNADTSYVLAFTATMVTVFRDDGSIADTVAGGFGDPFLLQFVQINDVVFLTSRDVSPKRLERVADADWQMEEIPFTYEPFLDQNLDVTKVYSIRSFLFPEWVVGTAYTAGTFVTHFGHVYDCTTISHVASAADEPGVGASWTTKWLQTSDEFASVRVLAGQTGYIVGPAFDPGQVGAVFEIDLKRRQDQFESTIRFKDPMLPGVVTTSPPIIIKGKWSFITTGTWDSTVYIEQSFDQGITWSVYRTYTSSVAAPANFTTDGTEDKLCQMRIRYSYLTGPAAAGTGTITSEEPYLTSRIRITGFPTAGVYTTASFLALEDIEPGSTDAWREGAFSAYQGYPAAIAVQERRLTFAGTPRHPVSIWMSRTDDLLNFTPGSTEADASIFITLAATRQDPIRWIASQRRMIVGTAGSEWVFGSDTSDAALSPTNLLVRQYTYFGSAVMPALTMQTGVFFIERQGRRLREMAYQVDQESYDAADLTRLAEHITESGMVQTAWQGNREPALWGVRADGTMVHFTYIRSEKVAAWSRHVTQGGLFRSVAVVRNEADDDVVYVVVERNGVHHLEYFAPSQQSTQEAGDLAHCYHMDSGVTAVPDSSRQVGKLEHLEGQTVAVLADGYPMTLTVTGGKITLPYAYAVVSAGLPVESRLITLPPEIQADQGMSHGKLKRANSVKLSLYRSYGGSILYNGQTSDVTTTAVETPGDAPPPLATGWFETTLSGGYEADMQFEIHHATPHPYTVRAAALQWSVSETQ